jgi:hypothetical protein
MTLDQYFWKAVPIKPAPALAALRDLVLERSETRSPKWKFRLAPDLVLQIQPKLTTALLKFKCRSVRCEGADLTVLLANQSDIKRLYHIMDFELRADAPDAWFFKVDHFTSGGMPPGTLWNDEAKSQRDAARSRLRQDLIDAFQAGRFDVLRPDLMLGSHCLICGKGLTDPVSQARHIGPECAGTSSEQLPFVLALEAAE